MKKFVFIVPLLLTLFALPVLAKKDASVQGKNKNDNNIEDITISPSSSPTITLSTSITPVISITTEQEFPGKGMPKNESTRSETAVEHMSIVAEKVQEILENRTLKGGIGDQVREIAQEQKQSQKKLKISLIK